jgi:hypothetical protein
VINFRSKPKYSAAVIKLVEADLALRDAINEFVSAETALREAEAKLDDPGDDGLLNMFQRADRALAVLVEAYQAYARADAAGHADV